ncbi:TPM domain-containing protein [Paenibacillus sp. GbtcB18]|uniref:TPM domain-containing protein n=1 Tax=Paenibacillus sp. GbtcB18 TaxID=2824763 RepID=UPI001C2FE590|nr:TPM domain-containing protein [Paenibacillus sp. GbtcB18]
MKTIRVIGLALLLIFLTCTAVFAAAVPRNNGIVTDPVGLLTQTQARQVESGLKNKDYEVFVLTAKGLTESEGERLANEAYDQWGLNRNQLMLVITTQPNFVHLVYENEQLAAAVSRSKAKDAKGIVDLKFVPAAGEGKIGEGILAVSGYVNSLAGAGASSGNVGDNGASNARGGGMASILPVVLGLAVIGAGFWAFWQYKRRSAARKRLAEAKQLLDETRPVLNGMLFSEVFQDLEKQFLQGETKEKAAELENAVVRLQGESEELAGRLAELKLPFLINAKAEAETRKLFQAVQEFAGKVGPYGTRLAEIEKQSTEVRKSVDRAKSCIAEAEEAVEALARRTGYPLTVLRKHAEQAKAAYAKADELDEFDFMQAASSVEAALKELDFIRKSVKDFEALEEREPGFLPAIQASEQELRERTRQEGLLLTDGDPYALLKQAREETARLGTLLEAGDTEEGGRSAAAIEENMGAARSLVEAMIADRESARKTAHEIEELTGDLGSFDRAYPEESLKIARDYAEVHRREQQADYTRMTRAREELGRRLTEIRSGLAPDVQKYRSAREAGTEAQALMTEIRELRARILGYHDSLDARVRTVRHALDEERGRLRQAASAFGELQVESPELSAMIGDGESRLAELEQLAQAPVLDVDLLEERQRGLSVQAGQAAERVQQLLREKEETLRTIRQLEGEYRSRHARYGGSMSLSPYSSGYDTLMEESRRLIARGLFAEAMQRISSGQQLLEQMDRDYQRRMYEEQLRRRGPGGPGGGGSSGSSGWGGGGGRSSGGSGWGGGSSGGRSSGSSKW